MDLLTDLRPREMLRVPCMHVHLSFITDEASDEPAEFLRLARQFGVHALELRSVHGVHVAKLDPASRRELRASLDDANVGVCCIDSPVFKCDIDSSISPQLDVLRRAIDTAAYFDCSFIRVFSFWRRPDPAQYHDRIVEALSQAAEIARPAGMRLLIENGKSTMHSSGRELADLLYAVDPRVYAALWDPGSCLYGGTEVNPVEAGYPLVKSRILHVHIKDPSVYRGAKPALLERGIRNLDLARQLDCLREEGYSGYVSLETHWRADPAARDDSPASAYAATERALASLHALLMSPYLAGTQTL